MLPFENRLLKKKDFERVKKEGQKLQGGFLGLLVSPNKLSFSRFGFIISKKISKKATQRNRAKRLLREAVRINLVQIKPGFDFLFLGKKELLMKSFLEIQAEVQLMLKKLN